MRSAPSAKAISFLCLLLATTMLAQAQRGFLGVHLADVDADRAKAAKLAEVTGAQIVGVEENSGAEQAGLKVGDVILLYNSETVLGSAQLGRLVAETPPGRKVMIRISRDGKTKEVAVTTGPPSAFFKETNDPNPTAFVSDIPAPLMVWRNMILGIYYEPLSPQLAQFFGVKQGSLIRAVEPGSLAEHAGIRAGDVLTSVAGHTIFNPRDFGAAIRLQQGALKPMPLDFTRERKAMTISINLSENK